MNLSFEHTLIEVWRQSLVEIATVVELDGIRYSVRRTPKRALRQADFVFDGNEIRDTPFVIRAVAALTLASQHP